MEEELENLRRRTARQDDVYEDLTYDEATSTGFWRRLTPGQRLFIASLILADILAAGCGLLWFTGRIALP